MPEQILGASGFYTAHVDSSGRLATTAAVTASVSFDPLAGSPGGNFPGSVIMLGGIDSATGSIGYFTSTNNKLDTNATVSMTGGSGFVLYSGDVANIANVANGRLFTSTVGSVEVSNFPSSYTVTATNLDIRDLTSASDSVAAIGSVQVSSVVGALPAGTNLIGSIHGIKESLPVGANVLGSVLAKISTDGTAMLGSVKIGTIPTGTNIIGSVAADIQKIGVSLPAGTNLMGSVVAKISSDGTASIGSILGIKESLPAGANILGSVLAKITSDGTAMLGSVKIGTIPVGTNLIGSVAVDIQKVGLNVPVVGSVQLSGYTGLIGSVNARISDQPPAWAGTGSVYMVNAQQSSAPGSIVLWDGANTVSVTNNKLDVNATVSLGSGMVLYSGDVANIAKISNGNLSVIGSVAVSNTLSVSTGSGMVIYSGATTNIADVTSGRLGVNALGSVQVSSILGALPAGTNNIGDTDVLTLPPIGGSVVVNTGSVQLQASTNLIGSILGIKEAVSLNSLPAGTNNIGDMDVLTLPPIGGSIVVNSGSVQLQLGTVKIGSICGISESLPAGANKIGSVLADIQKIGVALPAGTALIGSVNVAITKDGTAVIGSTLTRITDMLPVGQNKIGSICGISESLPVGANKIGSVLADIQKIGVALPEGTNTIGSVGLQGAWTGVGSITNVWMDSNGSFVSFNWTTAVTGSALWIPAPNNRVCITDVFLSSSGANLITLYYDSNDSSHQICKASLVAGGGFVNNYTKPFVGPTNGSVKIDTAIAVPGYISINGFEKV